MIVPFDFFNTYFINDSIGTWASEGGGKWGS